MTTGDEVIAICLAPEKRLEVVQSKPALESVNISCLAQGVYPEPKMALYKDPDREERWVKLQTESFILPYMHSFRPTTSHSTFTMWNYHLRDITYTIRLIIILMRLYFTNVLFKR